MNETFFVWVCIWFFIFRRKLFALNLCQNLRQKSKSDIILTSRYINGKKTPTRKFLSSFVGTDRTSNDDSLCVCVCGNQCFTSLDTVGVSVFVFLYASCWIRVSYNSNGTFDSWSNCVLIPTGMIALNFSWKELPA